MKRDFEAMTREREEAWVGDAVLALYVREWILREHEELDGAKFVRFTSNDFLRALGNPTTVEAEIGVISGGSMIITTADGEVSIDTGERFLFAQAQIPATAAAATTTAPAAGELSGGTIALIVGGAIAIPIGWSLIRADDNKTDVSRKLP